MDTYEIVTLTLFFALMTCVGIAFNLLYANVDDSKNSYSVKHLKKKKGKDEYETIL